MEAAIGKAERTRKLLLDAALRVISRKGYTSATVDEIVKEAGVSKGLAYYHFKSKAAMASDILEHEIGQLVDEFERIAEQSDTAVHALRAMLEVFAERLYDQREFASFFMTEIWREGRAWSARMRDKTQHLVDIIAGQFARGQREGQIDKAIDPVFEAVGIVGTVLTETMYYVRTEGAPLMSRQEFVARICDFARRSAVKR